MPNVSKAQIDEFVNDVVNSEEEVEEQFEFEF
jgi:hypothetical protein